MKKIICLFSCLFSTGVFATDTNLDVCKTAASIQNLYSYQKNFDGLNKDILLKSRAVYLTNKSNLHIESNMTDEEKTYITSQEKAEEATAIQNFNVYSQNGKAIISSNDLSFNNCLKIKEYCNGYETLKNLDLSLICTPVGSKVTIKLY